MLGIIPKALKAMSSSPIGEVLVVSSMQETITEMLKHANAFIFLLGDHATLEALITFTSWACLNIHKKLISLLNVNNFFYGFITFINHVIKNYFISVSMKQLFICAPIANKLLDLLETCRPELDLKTLTVDWSTDDGSSSSKLNKLDLILHL